MNLMTLHGVLFLNVLTFLVSHELFIEGKECKQDDLCSCSFDDGRKVDISSLGNTDGTPRISTECDVFPQEKDLCTRFMKHREREALEVFLMNLVHRSFSCGKTSHSVDIRLTYRVDNASMADYDSDEILPQALDLFEDQENCITQNKERFADVKSSKDGNIYSYNPCKPFKEASCTNDAAACVQDPTKTQSVQIGDASKAAFKYDKESGNVVVGYTSGTFSDLRLTQVIFVCDQSAKEPVFTAQGEEQGGEFQLTVTSVCACPDGCTGSSAVISGGTIILIAFFSSLVLYFSIGIVVQKAVRKKEGKELIPNSEFWFGVLSNIKSVNDIRTIQTRAKGQHSRFFNSNGTVGVKILAADLKYPYKRSLGYAINHHTQKNSLNRFISLYRKVKNCKNLEKIPTMTTSTSF